MDSHEAEQVKRQLLNNIESSFPKEKADILKRQIMSMNDKQLESFLDKSKQQPSGCIFCSIASGSAESYKISENDSAVAVLEINPVSKGHTLIISKEHLPVEKFSKDISSFAKTVADNIKEKLKPKDVEIASVDFGGHGVINLIPVYNNENVNSKKYKASKEELDEVLKILNEEKSKPKEIKIEKIPKPKKIREKRFWLPKRIP